MKKRILSLFVALCLVVGLMPVIAMAGTTTETLSADIIILGTTYNLTNTGDVKYFTTSATGTVTKVSEDPSYTGSYNIKLLFPAESDTVEIYLVNAYIKRSGNNNYAFTIGSTTNKLFNAKITVEGTNTIEHVGSGTVNCIRSVLNAAYTTTITSRNNGTLSLPGNGKNGNISLYAENDIILDNVTITSTITPASGASSYKAAIWVKGDLTIDGGSLNVYHPKHSSAILVDDGTSVSMATGAGKFNLEIKNGATVTAEAGTQVIRVNGECIIDNSEVTITTYSTGTVRHVYSKTGGLTTAHANNCVDVRNATVQQSFTKNGSDPIEIDPITVEDYSYAKNVETSNYRYFHTTPVGGGDESDEITISAAMDLGADLSYVAFVDPADVEGKTDLKAKITHTYADGREADVQESAMTYGEVQGNNWYYASYEKLAAKEMMDELKIEIFAGEEKIAEDTQTVRSYIERMVDTVDADWQKAYLAILNYGAGAQDLFDYNEGNPANGSLTGTLASVDLSGVTVPTGAYTATGNYKGMRLAWENSIAAVMFVDGIEEGMTAKFTVGGQEYDPVATLDGGENGTGFKCTAVDYADLETDIVLTVYNAGGTAVATYTDSMASYITRMSSVSGIDAFAVMCVCVAAAL